MLGLLWNLAHSEDVPTDIMDLALSAHIKILDYSCSQVCHHPRLHYNMGQGCLTYRLGVKMLGLVPFVFQNVK